MGYLRPPSEICGFEWLRFITVEGEHIAVCQNRKGHPGAHRDGPAWISQELGEEMADYGYDRNAQKHKDSVADREKREAEAERVKAAMETMRNIVPAGEPVPTKITAGESRVVEADGSLGAVPEPDPTVLRELKLKLAEARERRVRAQDLPETSRARQEAELDYDKIVEQQHALTASMIPFPSPYPNSVPIPSPVPGWGTTTTLTPPKTGATMDVFIIWAIVPDQPEAPWAITAWDDESIAENEDGWLEALANAEETYGGRYVRVTKTSINYDNVVKAFKPVDI